MPTLSLYQNPISLCLDASHQVQSPGGYEWWYFDAEDELGRFHLVGIIFQGFVFHPGYLRRYFDFVAHPTRTAPPLPREYPCAYFAVYEGGKLAAQFLTQYPAEEFAASAQDLDVHLGANFIRGEGPDISLHLQGAPWNLTWQGPKTMAGPTLSADLKFQNVLNASPVERIFLSRAMTGAEHRWVIAAPLCKVSGNVYVPGKAGRSSGHAIQFNGRGYHDHNFGTGPIGPGLHRWIWGRVLGAGEAVTFHVATPRDSSLADEAHVIVADASGIHDRPVKNISTEWNKSTLLGLRFPSQVSLDDVLLLSHPRVVDASPFYLRLVYDAIANGEAGQAFCEIAYPHRLRWPVQGRMIEMSIDDRS